MDLKQVKRTKTSKLLKIPDTIIGLILWSHTILFTTKESQGMKNITRNWKI